MLDSLLYQSFVKPYLPKLLRLLLGLQFEPGSGFMGTVSFYRAFYCQSFDFRYKSVNGKHHFHIRKCSKFWRSSQEKYLWGFTAPIKVNHWPRLHLKTQSMSKSTMLPHLKSQRLENSTSEEFLLRKFHPRGNQVRNGANKQEELKRSEMKWMIWLSNGQNRSIFLLKKFTR